MGKKDWLCGYIGQLPGLSTRACLASIAACYFYYLHHHYLPLPDLHCSSWLFFVPSSTQYSLDNQGWSNSA